MTSKKKGILFLLGPIAYLVIIMVAYAVVGFVFGTAPGGEIPETAGRGLIFILSFGGLLGVFALVIGIPFGIYYLAKKDLSEEHLQDKEAYMHLSPEQLAFIKGASLGAFLFSPLWAGVNRLWGAFFMSFIPIVNLFSWIDLTVSGKQRAWEKAHADGLTFEEFKERQRRVILGVVVFYVLLVGFSVLAEIYAPDEAEYRYPNSEDFEFLLEEDSVRQRDVSS